MDIYFLRHGQSEFNEDETNDTIDCPLTLVGIEQVQNLNIESYPNHYSLIVSSPLRRCIQTFKYSNLTSDQFEIKNFFREIYNGCKSDLLNENEILSIENEENIQKRIFEINNYLLELKNSNISNVLIITHADLVWNLTSYQVQGETFGTWLNNAQLFHWKRI